MTPEDERLTRQVVTGTNLIKYYAEKTTERATNDPKLTAMSAAVIMTLKQNLGSKITEDMGRVLALAMVAAYEYGRSSDKGTK
jgi:hypothetical protein